MNPLCAAATFGGIQREMYHRAVRAHNARVDLLDMPIKWANLALVYARIPLVHRHHRPLLFYVADQMRRGLVFAAASKNIEALTGIKPQHGIPEGKDDGKKRTK